MAIPLITITNLSVDDGDSFVEFGMVEKLETSTGSLLSIITVSILTIVVITAIIFGNTLVCVAVATERSLKAVQNRFLVSLAVADLTVGVLIMPLGLVNQVLGYWVFGVLLCDMWKVFDVLACTASIWNLCLIAIDRYFCITQAVKYKAWRTPGRVHLMILFVWTLSTVISVPPLLGWKAKSSPTGKFKCLISEDVGYILFSTLGSFYIPAVIMLVVYINVWRAAHYRARANSNPSRSFKTKSQRVGCNVYQSHKTLTVKENHPSVLKTREQNGSESNVAPNYPNNATNNDGDNCYEFLETGPCVSYVPNEGIVLSRVDTLISYGDRKEISHNRRCVSPPSSGRGRSNTVEQSKRKLAHRREIRATLVLGIIMGTFLACWYPFFQLYVISALCGDACSIPTLLFDIIFWIGYCNSALNPLIYTVFNRDFRRAFSGLLKKLLRKSCCKNYQSP